MRGTPVRQVDFTGGLNTKAAPYLVEPNECRDCLNVVTTTRGSVKKRDGSTEFVPATAIPALNAGAAQVFAIFAGHGVPTIGNCLIVLDEDGQAYSISTAGVVTDISVAAFATALGISIIQAPINGGQGPIYFSDSNTNNQWTGSGNVAAWTASLGTVPVGAFSVYFKNRVWIAGQPANPSSLFFSDIGNPRSWPVANVVNFDPTDGDGITGIGTCGPYLLVFKRNKAWVVYDLDTGANRPLGTNIGCAAHRSITESPKGTFFLTQDKGVWVTDGKKLSQVSEKITPTLDAIPSTHRQYSAGAYLNDHYYMSFFDTSFTSKVLDYDTTTKSWWMHDVHSVQFAIWRRVNSNELYTASDFTTRIDRVFVPGETTDANAANILCRWTGPWLSFGEPYRNKRIRQVHVDGSGVVDAYKQIDYTAGITGTLIDTDIFDFPGSAPLFGGAGNFGGDGIFGGSSSVGARRLYSLGVARAFSFQIQATQNGLFEMDSYTTYINLREN